MAAADRPLLQVHLPARLGAQAERQGGQGSEADDDQGGVHGRGSASGGCTRFAGSQR